LKDLQEKVNKKKATPDNYSSAKKVYDNMQLEVVKFTEQRLKELVGKITQAYADMYTKLGALLSAQAATVSHGADPSVQGHE